MQQTGAKFVASLNAFQRLAYVRLSAERETDLGHYRHHDEDEDEEEDREPERERRQRDTTVTRESFAVQNGVRVGSGGGGPPVPVKG